MFNMDRERLNYGTVLQPRQGYVMEFSLCLTYSLDLEALLGTMLSLGLGGETDSSIMRRPCSLLEAVCRCGKKMAVICNAGSIAVPVKGQNVYPLLEKSIFEAKLESVNYNFHPKLWAIKYTGAAAPYIKLIVLTRNLTFGMNIDACVVMEGEISDKENKKHRGLAQFILNSASFVDEPSKREKIKTLADEILHTDNFYVDEPFEEYEFLPISSNGTSVIKELTENDGSLFAISPFLSDNVVKELARRKKESLLITRKDSITPAALNVFNKVFFVNDLTSGTDSPLLGEVHAKLYFLYEKKKGAFLYIGSANATNNAFYHNTEFLIKLKFKDGSMNFQRFCDDFFPKGTEWWHLAVTPYADTKGLAADDEADMEEAAIKEAAYAVTEAAASKDGTGWMVEITAKKLKSKVKVSIAPLQAPSHSVRLKEKTKIEKLSPAHLSEFYLLKTTARSVVVKIKTDGIPRERDDYVFRNIIVSKEEFLTFVSNIISENCLYDTVAMENAARMTCSNKKGNGSAAPNIQNGIYERLLKVAYHSPEKLSSIEDCMEHLDKKLIGDDFIGFFKYFQTAAGRLKNDAH